MKLSVLSRATGLIRYLQVFSSLKDVLAYRRLAYFGGEELTTVRIRGVPVPIPLRPHTTDATVLWETFGRQYHLPPVGLPKSPVILDLGANVGFTAVHMSVLYPGSRIIAVEMDDRNAECARRLLSNFPNCQVVQAAIWSDDGEVAYDPRGEEWGFHVEVNPSSDHLIRVPAITISTLMDRQELDHVDYLKMDIEGAEWPVLSSHTSWLHRVNALKIELHPQFNPRAVYENCAGVLENHGFICERDSIHFNALSATRSTPVLG